MSRVERRRLGRLLIVGSRVAPREDDAPRAAAVQPDQRRHPVRHVRLPNDRATGAHWGGPPRPPAQRGAEDDSDERRGAACDVDSSAARSRLGALWTRQARSISTGSSTPFNQSLLFRTSGYGLSDKDPVDVSFRERLTAPGFIIEGNSGLTTYNLKTSANPAKGKGGACNGDPGGPVLFEGTNVIAGVVSFGFNGQCKGIDVSDRLDREPVLTGSPTRTGSTPADRTRGAQDA